MPIPHAYTACLYRMPVPHAYTSCLHRMPIPDIYTAYLYRISIPHTCIPPCLYRHAYTGCLYRIPILHAYTAYLYRISIRTPHAYTAISIPPCLYRHAYTAVPIPPCLYRHAYRSLFRRQEQDWHRMPSSHARNKAAKALVPRSSITGRSMLWHADGCMSHFHSGTTS